MGKFKLHDKVRVVGSKGLASKGWVGTIVKVDATKKGWPYTVYFLDRGSTGEYGEDELGIANSVSQNAKYAFFKTSSGKFVAVESSSEESAWREAIKKWGDDVRPAPGGAGGALPTSIKNKPVHNKACNAKFKVGDKVKSLGQAGSRGEVVSVGPVGVKVEWDNGNSTWEREHTLGACLNSANPVVRKALNASANSRACNDKLGEGNVKAAHAAAYSHARRVEAELGKLVEEFRKLGEMTNVGVYSGSVKCIDHALGFIQDVVAGRR